MQHTKKDKIRIGSGHGFWGDIFEPGAVIVEKGDVDYMAYDFLGEPTIPLLQQERRRDLAKGYVPAITALIRSIFPTCIKKGIRIVTNAGAANPEACAERIAEVARNEFNISGFKIGIVLDPDVSGRIDELRAKGIKFKNLDTGEEDIGRIRDRIVASYVYLGSELIVEALEQGANIVITGRTTDDAAILGPLVYEFGWKWDDWDLLAKGIAAGHLIECAGCVTGGISCVWKERPEPWNLGYPIVEVGSDGDFIVTKVQGTGGLVDMRTVTEHLVYEVHDPANYIMPEVITDWSNARLEQVGENTVRVSGIRGKPRPSTLKVCFAHTDGFIGEGFTILTLPDALGKARHAAEQIRRKLEMMKLDADEVRYDYIGYNAILGSTVPEEPPPGCEPNEIMLRVAAKCKTYAEAAKIGRVMTWLIGAGPIGNTGQLNTPPPREVLALWPSLIPREEAQGRLVMKEV